MRSHFRGVSVLLVLGFAIMHDAAVAAAQQTGQQQRLAAEVAVYARVLADPTLGGAPAAGRHGLVVIDRTVDLQDELWWKGSAEYGMKPLDLRTLVAGATQALVDDFRDVLRRPADLAAPIGSRSDLVLVSRQRLDEVFRGSDGWARFYSQYPDTHGYVEFSRVGFDDTAALALVYVGHHYGLVGGVGAFVLLRRQDAGWTIVRWYGVWES